MLLGRAAAKWLERMADSELESPGPDTAPVTPNAAKESGDEPESPLAYPRVQRHAMGSLFEVYLAGTDRDGLVAAGESAMDEIERLDRQLSHYRDDSDIARLNANAGKQWVRLEPRLYRLIHRCCELSRETEGAFDITAGSLVKAWGFHRGEGRIPPDEEIGTILEGVGFYRILFDDDEHLVYFTNPGLDINLGAIGKGYALDEAASILRFYSVRSAVLHGGHSTIYALGGALTPQAPLPRTVEVEPSSASEIRNPQSAIRDSQGWPFQIKDPRDRETVLATAYLNDEAISTSGSYEQFFEADGVRYSHIVDPRTGRPAHGILSVSVIAPSAADSDALSTAFFVMGRQATEEYCRTHPNLRVIIIAERSNDEIEVVRIGFRE
jgi:thiamine biosynthesis lipoprotein